ncbi:DivIVA domain-containing protein [Micromonospora sp. DT48]|uniref:DivIVA domain-containing protein n=1 Tax=Micromonospora sp. DT48 TaxID=3393429 RepID=UPI003CEE2908
MDQLLLLLVVAVTVAAVVFGVTALVTGRDPGLTPVEADGRAVPLPGDRPLRESDVGEVRFDIALRGYRMAQVDQAMRRAAYDIGYKAELIGVLEAEVTALRDGRTADADALRRAREQAANPTEAEAASQDAPVIDLSVTVDPDGVSNPGSGAASATEAEATATEPTDRYVRPAAEQSAADGKPVSNGQSADAAADPTTDGQPTTSDAPANNDRESVVRSEST